jgi:hypothetical protein
MLKLESNNKMYLYVTNSGLTNKYIGSDSTLAIGQRYHVAASYDGTKLQIYVNGIENISTVDFSGTVLNSDERLTI